MNRPSYKELWLDEVKSNAEGLEWVRDAVDGNAEVYTDEPYSEGEYLARKIMQMHARIAELEAVVDKLIWSVEGRVEFMYSKHQREFEDIVAEYKERE